MAATEEAGMVVMGAAIGAAAEVDIGAARIGEADVLQAGGDEVAVISAAGSADTAMDTGVFTATVMVAGGDMAAGCARGIMDTDIPIEARTARSSPAR